MNIKFWQFLQHTFEVRIDTIGKNKAEKMHSLPLNFSWSAFSVHVEMYQTYGESTYVCPTFRVMKRADTHSSQVYLFLGSDNRIYTRLLIHKRFLARF